MSVLQVVLLTLSGAGVSVFFQNEENNTANQWEERTALERAFSLNFYFTIGCGVVSLLFAVVGHVKLNATVLTLIPAIASCAALFHLRRAWFAVPRYDLPAGILDRIVVIALIAMILLNGVGTLSPEVRFDSLAYHLQVPRLWLNFGRMMEVPENGHSYFPYGFEMLYAWSLSLGSDSAAKALHYLAGISAALWCARIGRSLGASPLYCAALFYFIHFISFLSTTTYIDLATAMYALAAVALWVERIRGTMTVSRIVAMGILTGSAMATKYTAWPIVGVPMALAVVSTSRKNILTILLFGISAAMPLLPWAVRNFEYVGNPVAPLMVGIFGPESAVRSGLAGSFDSFAGTSSGLSSLLLSPLSYGRHLVLQKYTLGLLGMMAGMALVIGLRKRSEEHCAQILGVFGLLVLMFLCEAAFTRGHPDGRYGLAGMGLGGVLVAVLCSRLYIYTGRRGICFVAPALCLAMFGSALVDRSHFQTELGEEWTPIFSSDKRDDYRVAHEVQSKNFRAVETLLTQERAGRVIGLNYPSEHMYWVWIQGMRNDLIDSAGGEQAAATGIQTAMNKLGFTHIIDGVNPGFSAAHWQEFLTSDTDSVDLAGANVRRVRPVTAPGP